MNHIESLKNLANLPVGNPKKKTRCSRLVVEYDPLKVFARNIKKHKVYQKRLFVAYVLRHSLEEKLHRIRPRSHT